MQKYFYLLLTSFLFFSISYVSADETAYLPGELIIHLEPGVQPEFLSNSTQIQSLIPVKVLVKRMNIWLFSFDPSLNDHEVLTAVNQSSLVKVAQFNHKIEMRENIPNDASFATLWNFRNTGQNGGTMDADIDAGEAWDSTTGGLTYFGDTIVVAVIDGGFYYTHEDLNFFKNYKDIPNNGIDDDGNGYIDDYHGWNSYSSTGEVDSFDTHGTHVAGIIGAKGNNGIGVVGVNWNVKVLPISGSSTQESTVVESYGYVVAMRALYDATGGAKGAFIVSTNSSFGVNFGQPSNYPIWCAMYDSMGKYGILSAAATMNNGSDVDATSDIPTACASNFMISVTNTTNADTRNNGAAFGATTIDIGAPGTQIISTFPGNGYASNSGTSMASPHIAGAVGLLHSAACEKMMEDYYLFPDSIALVIKQALLDGVDTLSSLLGATVSGGRLNMHKSIVELDKYNCTKCGFNYEISKVDLLCFGDSTGSLAITTSGNNFGLQYNWSNGSTSAMQSNLAQGNYTLTITDTAGCTRFASLFLFAPDEIQIGTLVPNAETSTEKGKIYVEASGGVPPIEYSIDGINFQTSSFFTGLDAGDYTVYMRDANGCIIDTELKVDGLTGIKNLNKNQNITIYPNPANNRLFIAGSFESNPIELKVINTIGKTLIQKLLPAKNRSNMHIELDISSLSQGIYFIHLQQENSFVVTPFVVE